MSGKPWKSFDEQLAILKGCGLLEDNDMTALIAYAASQMEEAV